MQRFGGPPTSSLSLPSEGGGAWPRLPGDAEVFNSSLINRPGCTSCFPIFRHPHLPTNVFSAWARQKLPSWGNTSPELLFSWKTGFHAGSYTLSFPKTWQSQPCSHVTVISDWKLYTSPAHHSKAFLWIPSRTRPAGNSTAILFFTSEHGNYSFLFICFSLRWGLFV